MARFSELSTNKTTILLKFIEDENILKCLVNNESNFLDISLPVGFDPTSLIYSQIYPYKFIPTTETEAKTFITMSFNYKSNRQGTLFKNGSIYFYIITHNSLIRTDYGVLRYDYLVNQIDELLNSSTNIGIGQLPFYDMGDFSVNENYSGTYLAYKTLELQ